MICVCVLCWVAENGGVEESLRGDHSEHGERGGGACNAVGEESAALSARSSCHQRRGASNADSV